MATSSFDRKFEIGSVESLEKLVNVMLDETPKKPLSQRPFSSAERDKSEALLKSFLSHSN